MNDAARTLWSRRRWLASLALFASLAGCTSTFTATGGDPLPSWNEGSNKQRIIEFVKAVSAPGGADFVPVEQRIAVFDNDGTLWLEQPLYTQVFFVFERIRRMAPQHPEWQTKEPFKSVIAGDMKGAMAGGERGLFEMLLAAQSGMSEPEFRKLVNDWLATARDPRFKRPFNELTYWPMQELLRYMRANGFRTYIVSGGTVDFMRAFAESVYGIPPEQVIGSRQKLAFEATATGAQVKLLPEFEFNNDKDGKPLSIEALIGRRPIAAFGNSDGDFQMLQWTCTRSGRSLCMFVHHDDAVREYAYDRDSSVGRLAEGLDKYRAMGWGLISMKNDWGQVFSAPK